MRHNYANNEDDRGNDLGPDAYYGWEGWRRAFDKEHLNFYETNPPRPLIPLAHGYEYLIYDPRDTRLTVAQWCAASGWSEGYAAHPDQLVHCLPEVPNKPEEID